MKAAEAEAQSKALQGKGIADQRKAIVDGLRESVADFQEGVPGTTAQDVMNLVLMTQYFDTLKEIGSASKSNTDSAAALARRPDRYRRSAPRSDHRREPSSLSPAKSGRRGVTPNAFSPVIPERCVRRVRDRSRCQRLAFWKPPDKRLALSGATVECTAHRS